MNQLPEYIKFKKELSEMTRFSKRRVVEKFIEEKYLSKKIKMLSEISTDEPVKFSLIVISIYLTLTSIVFIFTREVLYVALTCVIINLLIKPLFCKIDEYNFFYKPFCRSLKDKKIKDKETEKIKKALKEHQEFGESVEESTLLKEYSVKRTKKENNLIKNINGYNQVVQSANVPFSIKDSFNTLVEKILKYRNLVVEKQLSLTMLNKIVEIYMKELSALIIMEEETFSEDILHAIKRVSTLVDNEISSITETKNIKGKSCLTALNNMLDHEIGGIDFDRED